MALIGSLAVSLLGDNKQLKKAFDSTEKQINKLEKKMYYTARSIGDMGKSMTTLITGPIVALGAGMFGLAQKTATAGDEVQKMALRTGFSTEALSELRHAAELSGTSLSGMENAVRRMQRSVLDLERGLSTQTESFAMLGLELKDLQGLSPEEQFEKITMALADVEDKSKQAALAQQLFGRSGTQLLPMLAAGSDGIAEMRQEARDLGIVFDQEAADASAQFNDDLDRLKKGFTGIFQELGTQLIPIFVNDFIPMVKETVIPMVRGFAEWISGLIEWFGGLSKAMQENVIKWTLLAAGIGPLLSMTSKLILIFKSFLPIIKAIKLAMAAINAPTLVIVAAIGALIAVTVELVRHWQETKTAIVAIWDYLKASVNHLVISIQLAFEHMKNAVLTAVNFMMDKLSILENLPFGIGEKFAGMKDAVSDSADKSAEKIEELQKRAKESGDNVMGSFGEVGNSFGELGGAIAGDVKGMVGSLFNFVTGTETAMAKGKESTDDTTESFVDLGISANNTGDSVSYLNTNLNETEETTRSVTDITDEMNQKLQQVNDELKVFGDESEANSRKASIYKNAIVELIRQFGPNHEKVQELIEVYKELTKEEEKVIESTFDTAEALTEMEKSLDIVENKSVAFGDSFDENSEKARILQNTISTLIENGIDPSSEKIQELVNRYNILAESSEEVEESTFSLEDAMKNYNVQLDILRNKNKVFGDSFDFAKQKADLLRSTINTLIENGVNPASPQIANMKAELDNITQTETEQLTFWDNLTQTIKDAGITIKNVSNQIANDMVNMFDNNYKAEQKYKNDRATIQEEIKAQMDELEAERQEELEKVGNNAEEKRKIDEKYNNLKRELKKEETDRLNESVREHEENRKSIKDVLKEMLIDLISALEKQVIAIQVAEMAKALAQSWIDWSAVARAAGAAALSTVAMEGLKGLIRGFELGGLVTGPVLGMIGEGEDDELVFPLNSKTFAGLAEGIVSQLSQMQMTPATAGAGATGRVSNVENNSQPVYNFYFPHAIDKAGTKRFVRNEVIPVINSETSRKGGN